MKIIPEKPTESIFAAVRDALPYGTDSWTKKAYKAIYAATPSSWVKVEGLNTLPENDSDIWAVVNGVIEKNWSIGGDHHTVEYFKRVGITHWMYPFVPELPK